MKRILFLTAALMCVLALAGCERKQYSTIEEAVTDGAVLGEHIVIDGVDVSGMSVLEARKLLVGTQRAHVAEISYIVRAGGESVRIEGGALGIAFNTDDVLLSAAALPKKSSLRDGIRELRTSVSINSASIAQKAGEAALSLNRMPTNAEAFFDKTAEMGFSYMSEREGLEVDAKQLALWLTEKALALEGGAVEAEASDIPADYTLEDAQNDTQLISEFTTSFKGATYSKANRVFNIAKAAALIDGASVEPGAEFSINEVLGPRRGEFGWMIATGIKYGAYVQEYGGGVCQVSTTLYNAALMADLTITERSHHSWPLGYVAIGRDATISTDGPDLRFVNNTGARIYIRASTDEEEKTVTVRIYGRPLPDGITIRVTSKKTGTLEDLGTEVMVDPVLASGEVNVVRESRIGVTSETYKEYYAADGSLLKKEIVSRDKYRSIKGLMYIGPAAETPGITPGGSPTPTQSIPGETEDPEQWN
ncbi:MAG TPA: VanW family protein [Clostridia bacterium]|nr:VanW family protein [Clostridia bacterium]